jgi:hypothetical protein
LRSKNAADNNLKKLSRSQELNRLKRRDRKKKLTTLNRESFLIFGNSEMKSFKSLSSRRRKRPAYAARR